METSYQVSTVVVEEEDDVECVTVAQGKAQFSNKELEPWKEAEIGRLAQQLEKLGEQLLPSQSASASAVVAVGNGIGREVDVLEDVPSPFDFEFDCVLALNEALHA